MRGTRKAWGWLVASLQQQPKQTREHDAGNEGTMGRRKDKDRKRNSHDRGDNGTVSGDDEENLAAVDKAPHDLTADTSPWGPCPICGEWLALHDDDVEGDLMACIEVLKANLAMARQIPSAPYVPPYVPLPWYPPTYPSPNTNPPWYPNTYPPVPMPAYPQVWCGNHTVRPGENV